MTRRLETSWRTRKTPLLRVWWPIQCCDLGHGMKCAGLRISWERVVVQGIWFHDQFNSVEAWHDLCHNISSYFTKVLHGSSSFVTTAADGGPCTNQSRILHWTHWTNQACHLGLLWDKSSWATPFGEQKLGRLILLDLISARNHIINSNFRSVFLVGLYNKPSFGMRVVPWFSQLSGRSLLTS